MKKEEIRKTIYNLELHEYLDISGFSVLRVAGGWIYLDKSSSVMVFVPFNNEYQGEKPDLPF